MSNYILNIDKLYSASTPQIVGRVADLPYMDFEFKLKDGDDSLDLTGCTIEFRGLTSTGHKIISANSVKVTSAKNGTIDFKIPKNFYSSPGKFERAYFAIKKSGRIDTTQDIIIHVLESVDLNAQDAENIIDAVDEIIAKVEKQIKQDTDRLIKQIKDDTASTIADSNKKLADLDKQINDFKNNTNSTISQINKQISNINSDMNQVEFKVDDLLNKVESNDLLTPEKIKTMKSADANYYSKFGFSNGILNEDGSIISTPSHRYSEQLIDIMSDSKYIFYQIWNPKLVQFTSRSARFLYYDSDKKIIERSGPFDVSLSDYTLHVITPPDNTRYFKFYVPNVDDLKIKVSLGDFPSDYQVGVNDLEYIVENLPKAVTALGGS